MEHVARLENDRWTRKLTDRMLRTDKRSRGRSLPRYTNGFKSIVTNWLTAQHKTENAGK